MGTGGRTVPRVIDPRSERAVYRQLADLLREQIKAGHPQPGGLLPSEGQLQQTYGVGRETVRRALRVLREEGLVVTEAGYGTRVREPVEQAPVRVPRGATVTGRMPTAAERTAMGIPDGVPVLVVSYGGREQVHPADRTRLTFA